MQRFHEHREWKGVHDVLFPEPTFARDHRAEPEEHRVFVAMPITVDHAFHAFVTGVFPKAPIHIEAIRARIEFDPGAGFGARIDHRVLIHSVTIALQQQPSFGEWRSWWTACGTRAAVPNTGCCGRN